MLNLDTHMLIHALAGDVKDEELLVLNSDRWGISGIVLWEMAKLAQLGRIDLDIDSPDLARVLSSVHVWPIDLLVSRQSTRLDFDGDPADELIAATSIVHNAPLLTRDKRIRASKQVPLALV
jgi:PIN domain nuclease of toxin-antitoxin system